MTDMIFPVPIGDITKGEPMLVGILVKKRINSFGAHLVMCDSLGLVFVRPSDDKRAVLMASRFPHMMAGVFNEAAYDGQSQGRLIA